MLRKRISLAILFILAMMTFSIGIAFAGPIFFIKDASHDFGEIEQGTKNMHVFVFENKGDEDLNILNVKPSCGCTAALKSSQTVKPGESGEIEVVFNSGKFKGKVKKTINVETNEEPLTREEKAPGLGPRITKEIKEPARVHKLYINATIRYDKNKEAALKRAREAAMKRSKENEAKNRAFVKPPNVNKEPVRSTVPPKIEYQPKKIELGDIDVNKAYKNSVKLVSSSKDEQYVIDKVAVSAPFASAMITKVNVNQNDPGEVSITVNPKSTSDVKNGKVLIYIVGNSIPVEVPISWSAK